jgi:hypothetical protein
VGHDVMAWACVVRNGMAVGRAPHTGVPEIGARPTAILSLCALFEVLSLLGPGVYSAPMSLKGQGAGDDLRYPAIRNPPHALSMTAFNQSKTCGQVKQLRSRANPMQLTEEGAGDDFWFPV